MRLSFVASFVIIGALTAHHLRAEDRPLVHGAYNTEITELMLKKATHVAHIKILPWPRPKNLVEENESKMDFVVEGDMVHPRYYCEVVTPIKGDLKTKDKIWFAHAQGTETYEKERYIYKSGTEYIVFFTTYQWGKLTGLVPLDNWASIIPYDSELKDILIWRIKHPDPNPNSK